MGALDTRPIASGMLFRRTASVLVCVAFGFRVGPSILWIEGHGPSLNALGVIQRTAGSLQGKGAWEFNMKVFLPRTDLCARLLWTSPRTVARS